MGVILHLLFEGVRKVYEKTLIGSKIKGDMRLRVRRWTDHLRFKSGKDTLMGEDNYSNLVKDQNTVVPT